jgi:hypothetical protein
MQLGLHWHTFLLLAILVAFPITGDDADAPITFNEGPLHILDGLTALLANLTHQLLLSDELLSHVAAEHFPIFDQEKRCTRMKRSKQGAVSKSVFSGFWGGAGKRLLLTLSCLP